MCFLSFSNLFIFVFNLVSTFFFVVFSLSINFFSHSYHHIGQYPDLTKGKDYFFLWLHISERSDTDTDSLTK